MDNEHYNYKHVLIEANGMPVPPLREYIPQGSGLLGSNGSRDYLSRSRETLNSTKEAEIKYRTLPKNPEIKTVAPETKPPVNPADGAWEVITGIPKQKKSINNGDDLETRNQISYQITGNPTDEPGFVDSGNETVNSKATSNGKANSACKSTTQPPNDVRSLSPSNSRYFSTSRANRDSAYETYEHTIITRTRSPSPGPKLVGFGANLFPEDRISETVQTTTVTTRRPSLTPQPIYNVPPVVEQTTINPTVPKPQVKSPILPISNTLPKSKKKSFCLCRSDAKSKNGNECFVPIKSRLVAEPLSKRGKPIPAPISSQNTNPTESAAATWLVKINNIQVNERILDPYQSIVPNYRSPQPLTIHGITGDFNINLKTDVLSSKILALEAYDGKLYHQGVPFARSFDKNIPLDLSLRFFGDQVYIYFFEKEIARLPVVIKRDQPHAIINITKFQKVDAVTREGVELKPLLPQPYVNKFHLKAGDVLYFATVSYTNFDLHFLNDDGIKLDRLRIRPSRGTVKHSLKKNTLLTYTYRETHHYNVIKITAKEFGNLYHLVINDVFIGNFIGSPIDKVKGIFFETPKYLLAFQHRPAKIY